MSIRTQSQVSISRLSSRSINWCKTGFELLVIVFLLAGSLWLALMAAHVGVHGDIYAHASLLPKLMLETSSVLPWNFIYSNGDHRIVYLSMWFSIFHALGLTDLQSFVAGTTIASAAFGYVVYKFCQSLRISNVTSAFIALILVLGFSFDYREHVHNQLSYYVEVLSVLVISGFIVISIVRELEKKTLAVLFVIGSAIVIANLGMGWQRAIVGLFVLYYSLVLVISVKLWTQNGKREALMIGPLSLLCLALGFLLYHLISHDLQYTWGAARQPRLSNLEVDLTLLSTILIQAFQNLKYKEVSSYWYMVWLGVLAVPIVYSRFISATKSTETKKSLMAMAMMAAILGMNFTVLYFAHNISNIPVTSRYTLALSAQILMCAVVFLSACNQYRQLQFILVSILLVLGIINFSNEYSRIVKLKDGIWSALIPKINEVENAGLATWFYAGVIRSNSNSSDMRAFDFAPDGNINAVVFRQPYPYFLTARSKTVLVWPKSYNRSKFELPYVRQAITANELTIEEEVETRSSHIWTIAGDIRKLDPLYLGSKLSSPSSRIIRVTNKGSRRRIGEVVNAPFCPGGFGIETSEKGTAYFDRGITLSPGDYVIQANADTNEAYIMHVHVAGKKIGNVRGGAPMTVKVERISRIWVTVNSVDEETNIFCGIEIRLSESSV